MRGAAATGEFCAAVWRGMTAAAAARRGPAGVAAGGERGRDAGDRAAARGAQRGGRRGGVPDDQTSTGYRLARSATEGQTLGIGYSRSTGGCSPARAWRRIAPDLVILTEGERWPEHMHQAAVAACRAGHQCAPLGPHAPPAAAVSAGGAAHAGWNHAAAAVLRRRTRRGSSNWVIRGAPAEPPATSSSTSDPAADRRRESGAAPRTRPARGLVLMGSSTWPGEEAALVEALRRGARAAGVLQPAHRAAPRRTPPGAGALAGRTRGVRYSFSDRGPRRATVDGAWRTRRRDAPAAAAGGPGVCGQEPAAAHGRPDAGRGGGAGKNPSSFGPGMGISG